MASYTRVESNSGLSSIKVNSEGVITFIDSSNVSGKTFVVNSSTSGITYDSASSSVKFTTAGKVSDMISNATSNIFALDTTSFFGNSTPVKGDKVELEVMDGLVAIDGTTTLNITSENKSNFIAIHTI